MTSLLSLRSDIDALLYLGYPQAALFGFCLALIAFNLYAVVMAALCAAHPTHEIDRTASVDVKAVVPRFPPSGSVPGFRPSPDGPSLVPSQRAT